MMSRGRVCLTITSLIMACANWSTAFRDDICGVSYSVRFNSMLIQIWNRDGDHEAGKQRILETVLREVPDELIPKRTDLYYYKKHSSHAGFTASVPVSDTPPTAELAN